MDQLVHHYRLEPFQSLNPQEELSGDTYPLLVNPIIQLFNRFSPEHLPEMLDNERINAMHISSGRQEQQKTRNRDRHTTTRAEP